MNALRNGGPAFPGKSVNDTAANLLDPFGTLLPPDSQATYSGMSLRDYFAAKAMEGRVAAIGKIPDGAEWDVDLVAAQAYRVADAMLKAREA